MLLNIEKSNSISLKTKCFGGERKNSEDETKHARETRFFLLSHPKRNQRKVSKVGNGLSIRVTGEIREEIDGERRRG